jgi:hypothetical protein
MIWARAYGVGVIGGVKPSEPNAVQRCLRHTPTIFEMCAAGRTIS